MREFEGGNVYVANDVIDMIIATAASRVDFVFEVKGYDMKSQKLRYGHNKYIETEVENDQLTTSLIVQIEDGANIKDVCTNIQEAVKESVESMLGLKCNKVDLLVV